jgi:hypothetical protein
VLHASFLFFKIKHPLSFCSGEKVREKEGKWVELGEILARLPGCKWRQGKDAAIECVRIYIRLPKSFLTKTTSGINNSGFPRCFSRTTPRGTLEFAKSTLTSNRSVTTGKARIF